MQYAVSVTVMVSVLTDNTGSGRYDSASVPAVLCKLNLPNLYWQRSDVPKCLIIIIIIIIIIIVMHSLTAMYIGHFCRQPNTIV